VPFTTVALTAVALTAVPRTAVDDSYDELVYQGSAEHAEADSSY
jgi:hypothetical protein